MVKRSKQKPMASKYTQSLHLALLANFSLLGVGSFFMVNFFLAFLLLPSLPSLLPSSLPPSFFLPSFLFFLSLPLHPFILFFSFFFFFLRFKTQRFKRSLSPHFKQNKIVQSELAWRFEMPFLYWVNFFYKLNKILNPFYFCTSC